MEFILEVILPLATLLFFFVGIPLLFFYNPFEWLLDLIERRRQVYLVLVILAAGVLETASNVAFVLPGAFKWGVVLGALSVVLLVEMVIQLSQLKRRNMSERTDSS